MLRYDEGVDGEIRQLTLQGAMQLHKIEVEVT